MQSYDIAAGRYRCEGPHDKISIVSVPRKHPDKAKVVAEPVLFPDGGNDGTSGTLRATTGRHDITAYQQIGLAAGACTGEGVILDIKNPLNPKVLASVEDPNIAGRSMRRSWCSAASGRRTTTAAGSTAPRSSAASTCSSSTGSAARAPSAGPLLPRGRLRATEFASR